MKLTVVVLSIVLAVNIYAQNSMYEDFGFGGPEVKFSKIAGERAVLGGGKGGKIISDNFAIGGAGYGLASGINRLDESAKSNDVSMAYGGVIGTYFLRPTSKLIMSSSVFVGGGGLSYEKEKNLDYDDEIFVLEPSVEIQYQTFDFMSLGIGAGYRYVTDVDLKGILDSDLSAATVHLTILFGNFINNN